MKTPFREGLYRAEFNTLTMQGIGLVVLIDGKIYGGDTIIYYVGTYSTDGDTLTARVEAGSYKETPVAEIESVLKRDRKVLELEGEIKGRSIELGGRSKEGSGIDIMIRLHFLHE